MSEDALNKSTSLNGLAWHRFCQNKLSVISLVVICLFVLMAVLGYLITPDSTPHCNQQYLELATLKPGSKVQFTYTGDYPDTVLDRLPTAKLVSQKGKRCVFRAEGYKKGLEMCGFSGNKPVIMVMGGSLGASAGCAPFPRPPAGCRTCRCPAMCSRGSSPPRAACRASGSPPARW